MDILQVSSSYRPAWSTGGTARFATQLSEQLVNQGNDITALTTNRGNKQLDKQTNRPVDVNGVTVFYLSNISNLLATDLKLITPYMSLPVVRDMISEFDVIHIHEHRTLLAAVVSYFARKHDVPYVIQEHGSLGVDRGNRHLKKSFDFLFGNSILYHADHFIAQTEAEKLELENWGINTQNISIIPLAISKSELRSSPKGPSLAERCGVKNHTPVVLFLGRLNKIKGLDILLESFPLIRDSIGNNLQLAIVGPDDGDEQRLKDLAWNNRERENIHFLGPLYNGEKCRVYSDASVYVLPSKYESFPTTVLEAGFFGTPAAISSDCSNSSMLEENEAAFVFDRTVNDLCDTVVEALNNNGKSEKIVGNLQSLVCNQLSWESVSNQIFNVYENVSESGKEREN